jgi:hypothetical protein
MGTRADFYIGDGQDAEWLGSVAWDGYEWAEKPASAIASAKTAQDFRNAVAELLAGRKDATLPIQGWPWPWNTSHTTDYAYAFLGDGVKFSVFGRPWAMPGEEETDDEPTGDSPDFPDMSARKNVTFGARSGVIVFGA